MRLGANPAARLFGRMDPQAVPTEIAGVESLRVTFPSQGHQLSGILYFRHAKNPTALPPAVIVTGSWTTVKEQMPARYAPMLAEAGYAALIFDFRGYGESEGLPREVESPALKAQDIRAAVAFLQTNGGVDGRRIGVLAICASAGYAVVAARNEDPGIKSIAMVAPWLHNKQIVRELYGGEAGVSRAARAGSRSPARSSASRASSATSRWPASATRAPPCSARRRRWTTSSTPSGGQSPSGARASP